VFILKTEDGQAVTYGDALTDIPPESIQNGMMPPFSYSYLQYYLKNVGEKLDYFEIKCLTPTTSSVGDLGVPETKEDDVAPSVPASGGGGATGGGSVTEIPVYEGYEYYLGKSIHVVLMIGEKKLELEPLNDQRYGFVKQIESKDFPLEMRVKNATSTGDCIVLLKRDNLDTKYYTLTKENNEKVTLGKQISFIPEGTLLSIRVSEATPSTPHPPFSVAVDGVLFKVISCGAADQSAASYTAPYLNYGPLYNPTSPPWTPGGGNEVTPLIPLPSVVRPSNKKPTRKNRRFGKRTYRRRRRT